MWLVTVPFLIWAVARAFGWERGWPWVQLMAFTPYAVAGSAVVAVLALVIRRWMPGVVAVVATVALVAVVAPRALSDGGRSAAGPALRVLTVNLMGGSVDERALVALVRRLDVDVLALQELTPAGDADLRAAGVHRYLPYAASLLGDFNVTLDHTALRRLVNSGYRDAAEVSGTGLRTSWPSNGQRLMLPVTLDHVLADRRIGVATARPYLIAGTDHRAVYAELVIPR